MAKRRTYSAETEARAVLELLREEKSLTLAAAQYGADCNQMRRCWQIVIGQFPEPFAAEDAARQQLAVQEQLPAQIGRLSIQVGWLRRRACVEHLPG